MTSSVNLSTTNFSGLASGVDTSAIISQLMQVERQPQQQLKNTAAAEQATIAAYQSVNTKMLALSTAADALTTPSTWLAATASASSTAVVATALAGAASGTYTFDVKSLAAAQVTTAALPATGAVTSGNGIDIAINGGTPTNVAVTTDTAQGVADAINGAALGVRASVLTSDTGPVLQLTATSTGTASSFTIAGLLGQQANQVEASNAKIQVGDPNAGGYTLTRPTNTFSDLIPNVTITATAKQDNVSVTVNSDVNSLANQVQTMVDAANGALAEIAKQTAYTGSADGTSAGTSGPLLADQTVQDLQQKLLGAVSGGVAGYGSLSQLGLSVGRDGSFSFNKSEFVAAYQSNPTSVETAMRGGVIKLIGIVSKEAIDPETGTVASAIKGHKDQINRLDQAISDWDTRLTAKQASLQTQFSAMEVALGKLKDQSNWLAGQIASLPTNASMG